MSLVVGERLPGGEITVVADSKLSYESRRSNPYTAGALKILLPRRDLCVGVAGIYDPNVLREAISLATRPFDPYIGALARLPNLDFVVASLGEGRRLVQIAGGEITEPSHGRAWVGDSDGYEAFQAAYLARGADKFEPDLRVLSSLQWVISFAGVASVGGFHLRAVSTSGGFRYTAEGTQVGPEVMTGLLSRSGARLSLSMRSQGPVDTFTMECCPGVGATFGACGYFIQEANVGLLWPHQDPFEPVKVKAGSPSEFVELARVDHGQLLHALRLA